jgi:energy-coupling factor transport system ATP-binding protein
LNKNDTPIIDVKELSHTYLPGTPLEVHSLDKVSMNVCVNETVGIIGPSGSGKSTLLQHLNGLLIPQEGDLLINGVSVTELASGLRKVRQSIGLVFQNPEKQLFEHYAGDDVAFGPRNMGLNREEIRGRVRSAMETVGLPFSFKDRLTAELSLGQKRRLALAGVLAMDPSVLVLDEPTSSLDPEGRFELLDILSGWKSEKGKALVIASHNMEDITELSDRVYVLVKGRVVASGSTREVFLKHEIFNTHGLSIPLPAQIIFELSKLGLPVSQGALTEDEAVGEIMSLLKETSE